MGLAGMLKPVLNPQEAGPVADVFAWRVLVAHRSSPRRAAPIFPLLLPQFRGSFILSTWGWSWWSFCLYRSG